MCTVGSFGDHRGVHHSNDSKSALACPKSIDRRHVQMEVEPFGRARQLGHWETVGQSSESYWPKIPMARLLTSNVVGRWS